MKPMIQGAQFYFRFDYWAKNMCWMGVFFVFAACQPSTRQGDRQKRKATLSVSEREQINLQVECKKGEGEACVNLAMYYEDLNPSQLPLALAAYKMGCKRHHAHACGSLGMMRFYGHGISPDEEKGKKEMEESCKLDYGQACANLGIIYALGRGVEVDKKAAKVLFEKGCRLKSETACSALESD